MPKDLAIVLCNGSLNSTVAATLAAQRHRIVLLNVDTAPTAVGSPRPASRLRAAYEQFAEVLKPFREHSVSIPFLAGLRRTSVSPLTVDPRQVVDMNARLLELLPIIATAARYAAFYEASTIHLGLRIGLEAAELAKATEYVQIYSELLQLACGQRDTEIIAPLLELDPWQVVDLGVQVSAPLERSWSCETDNATPCGVCAGCRGRDAAFEQAGKMDPLRRKL